MEVAVIVIPPGQAMDLQMSEDPLMDMASVLDEASDGAADLAAPEILVGAWVPAGAGAEELAEDFAVVDSTLPGAGNAHKIMRFWCTFHLKKSRTAK